MYQSIVVTVLLFGYTHSQDANCDFAATVTPGVTYSIQSPNYPNSYNPGSQCRWIATCPSGYNCRVNCAINMPQPQSSSCSVDRLLISRTGEPTLSGADYYCGQGSVSAVSTDTRIVVGIIVSTRTTGGNLSCSLYAQTATTTPDCVCGVRRTNRIVGGVQTDPYEFPMIAGVRYVDQDAIRCGGVIIANNYMLTAAHCVVGKLPVNITVEVGVYNQANSPPRQRLTVLSIRIHPNYVPSNNGNDIAILQVTTIAFNEYVSPVCLPFNYVNADFTGTRLTFLGWGTTTFGGPRSPVLRKVDLDVISQATCRNSVPALTQQQFCTFTAGKDACQDDSGGPGLYSDPQTGRLYIIGIISYGQACASNSPGVNTRVPAFISWITDNAPANYCRK